MNNTDLLDRLNAQFPEAILAHTDTYGMLAIEVARETVLPMLTFLKNDEALEMNFLTDLCGVHYPDQTDRELGLVYHVHSMRNGTRLRIKTFFPIADPNMPTATTLYPAAGWMERETFDFFGVIFDGHADLRRILNVDEMDYHPLRKEYRLEDGTRLDKDDRFFGRDGHEGREFQKRVDRA